MCRMRKARADDNPRRPLPRLRQRDAGRQPPMWHPLSTAAELTGTRHETVEDDDSDV
jgi:hypothetical protein